MKNNRLPPFILPVSAALVMPAALLWARGPYRHTRNPMIAGVLSILLGESALCGSGTLLAWAAAFFLGNTAWFKLVEEPGLVKRFGEEYLEYRANVPMWLPRLTPRDGRKSVMTT